MAEEIDTITITSTAPRTRTASELGTRIKAAGGALVVNATDSDFIVATNNGLQFSVTALPDGRYRVTDNTYRNLLIGVLLVGAVILTRR